MQTTELATKADIDRLADAVAALSAQLAAVTVHPAPNWISIPEAATKLGVHPRTIRNRIKRGEIKVQGAGRSRKVRV